MNLDPEFVEEFAKLKVSTKCVTPEELANFNEKRPLKERCQSKHPSFAHIPQFFYVPPPPADRLRHLLRKEAHSEFLQRQAEEQLDSEELKRLWDMLKQHVTKTTAKKQELINYDDYCKLQSVVGDKCRKYLTARLFAYVLYNSSYLDLVEIASIYNYTIRKVWITQCRIGLSFYDEVGQGYLREFDMENYLLDLIPTLPQICDCMQPSFQKFYICTVIKRFFFFLDRLRTGRIRIIDIVSSRMFHELMELRHEPKKSEEVEASSLPNCFSMPAVLEIYENYLSLDLDHNGLLSKEELSNYGSGTLSSVFLDRVFEECQTYDGEMDYKSFLDFVLALDNRQTPQGLHYLFRILDVEHTGYLVEQTLQYFFKDIQKQMLVFNSEEVVNFKDINNEIFDMVKPKGPSKITLQDLSNCGQGETVVSILIEFHKFWAYENHNNSPQNV